MEWWLNARTTFTCSIVYIVGACFAANTEVVLKSLGLRNTAVRLQSVILVNQVRDPRLRTNTIF
jgi:hypothetical protein